VVQRLQHTLAREAVQGPEQHQVEFAPGGVREKLLELVPVRMLAGGPVDVLVDYGPTLGWRSPAGA
jgi:hypothetical protein